MTGLVRHISHLMRQASGHAVASFAAVMLGVTAHPCAAQGPVADMRDALYAAITAPGGRYSGELRGDYATFVRTQLKTTSAVNVAVTTLRVFPQPGCRRLRAIVTAPGVTWRDQAGQQQSFSFTYEMNLCADGRAPQPQDDQKVQ